MLRDEGPADAIIPRYECVVELAPVRWIPLIGEITCEEKTEAESIRADDPFPV